MHRTTRARILFKSTACFAVLALFLLCNTCPVGFAGELQPVNGGPALTGAAANPKADFFHGPIKVATLNMAHGRKTAFHQVFLSRKTIDQNLTDISRVIKTASADIAALQEADGPSWWSGNFDHIALLAKKTELPWHSRAGYGDRWGLQYGAALMARRPYLETRGHRFESSWPTPAKGFLLVRFGWYPRGAATAKPVFVDVISVHLDFSRESVRTQQIMEMRKVLVGRINPLIIMGDFNSDWLAEDSVVRELARQSGMKAYRPETLNLGTYGTSRLDWILISADLEFVSYKVLPDAVSDHRAVIAEIGLKP